MQLNKALGEASVWGRVQILARAAELAERVIQIWPGPVAGAKGAPIGFDWSRVDSAVAAIPAGQWTTYGDMAILGGTSPQSVGHRMSSNPYVTNAYRVLDSQGRIATGFKWSNPNDERDPTDLLRAEGVVFGEEGTADPSQRLNALQLARLVEFDMDPDELARLQQLFAQTPLAAGNGEKPWLSDGKSWHLSLASAKGTEILRALTQAVSELTGGVQPNWGQKYYISWTNGSRIWLSAHPRKHWVWLALNRTPFTGAEAASRLGWTLVAPGDSPSWKNEGPPQVQASADGSTVWLQLRSVGDVDGQPAIRQLLMEAWNANQPSFM